MFSMASRCVVIGDLTHTHTHTTHTTERESLVTLPTRSKRTGRVLFGPSAENRASETNKRSNNRIGVQSESQVHGPGCGGLHAAHRACSWLPPSASYQIPRSSLQRQGFFFFLLPSFLQLCLSETPYVLWPNHVHAHLYGHSDSQLLLGLRSLRVKPLVQSQIADPRS
ncbi:hypothetical protein P167DRAFT_263930 [Morchella conica CCBAS932]|uniref:Uncharacterized protein n=1 Tax=Morchella conica CCBAS932 TaxID=1392247 RepID=A0A3N4LFA1_9PEZI|nr:hypothetical protein P167DRAFT_263930 [Morchella conica CCBAS932]